MRPTSIIALLSVLFIQGALALPHIRSADVDIHSRALSSDPAIAARQIADAIDAIRLERRFHQGPPRSKGSAKPSLKLITKNVCESGKYTAMPNVSALACARQVPIAFSIGGKCYLAAEHNLAAMGPTAMGICYLHSRSG